jgi:hypothetical protein
MPRTRGQLARAGRFTTCIAATNIRFDHLTTAEPRHMAATNNPSSLQGAHLDFDDFGIIAAAAPAAAPRHGT